MSFNLTNVGATLVASGGPGTGIMGGKYWSFDGVDDYLWSPDSATWDALTGGVTMLWWVRVPSTQNTNYANHWAKGDNVFQVRQNAGDEKDVRFDVRGGTGGDSFCQTTDSLTVGGSSVWHMLCAIYDPDGDGQIQIWQINNSTGLTQKLGSTARTGTRGTNTQRYTVGCQNDTADSFRRFGQWNMIPPAILNQPLSPAEQEALYAARNGNYQTLMLSHTTLEHFVNELDGLTDTTGVGPAWNGSFVRRANGNKARVRMPGGQAASVRLPSGARL